MKRFTLKTQFKIEFLLPLTISRKVLEKKACTYTEDTWHSGDQHTKHIRIIQLVLISHGQDNLTVDKKAEEPSESSCITWLDHRPFFNFSSRSCQNLTWVSVSLLKHGHCLFITYIRKKMNAVSNQFLYFSTGVFYLPCQLSKCIKFCLSILDV